MLPLITYEWNNKKFTSQDRLYSMHKEGQIDMEQIPHSNGFGCFFSFYIKGTNKLIASFYKDNSFGFCTQATGIELKFVTSI